ncbi:MAG TPA: DinB family protein [Thermoanaerobaculia bacterium]|nr:DinB family protein [Thermoanaerobaculia bacterium]
MATVTGPSAQTLPDDLAALRRQVEDNRRTAEDLVRGLSEAQLQWRPDERSWSIAQCLDHLAIGDRAYLEAMSPAVAEARRRNSRRRGPIQPGWFARWFIQSMEPPPRRKLPAPRKIVPSLGKSGDEVKRDYFAAQAGVLALLDQAAAVDLNRTRFVNPFLPLLRFTVGTGFLVSVAHGRRHLWQAERIRQRPGFPP